MSTLSDRSLKQNRVSSYNQPVIEVLLIEDSFPEAKLLAQIFKGSAIGNFKLTHVQRLSGAIEVLQTREFDVALLDLTLPDSEGLESLDTLIKCSPDLPVVVLTNTSDDQL
jgi:two-component system, cell cycle sensor histidine kinase and response regulator CckA